MTIVEKSAHVLPMLSADMAAVVERRLTQHGVHVLCGQSAKSITSRDDNSLELAMGAETLPCDVLLLSVGVRPNAELAKRSGLHVGSLGGVVVDEPDGDVRPADSGRGRRGGGEEPDHGCR